MELHPFRAVLPRPDLIAFRTEELANARETFDRLRAEGGYEPHTTDGFYLLRIITADGKERFGICGLTPVEAYGRLDGSGIRPHEATLPRRVAEHRERMLERDAIIKPVLLTRATPDDWVSTVSRSLGEGRPVVSMQRDGISYEVIEVKGSEAIARWQKLLTGARDTYVVADGHHRISMMQSAWKRFGDRYALLPVIVMPDVELEIDTFIRSITPQRSAAVDLDNYFVSKLLEEPALPREPGEWLLARGGQFYGLKAREEYTLTDPEWFNEVVLDRCFDITDSRNDPRIQSWQSEAALSRLRELAAADPAGYHFIGFPLSMADFLDCVRDGRLLPPKSTYFHPRIPTGLIVCDY